MKLLLAKRTGLLLLFLVCLACQTKAQSLSFGLKAGLNIATQKFEDDRRDESLEARLTLHGGGFLASRLSNKLELQLEALYNNAGSQFSLPTQGTQGTNKFTYLSFPLMVKIYPNDVFNFQVGPQVSFLLGDPIAEYHDYERKVEDIKTTDLGLNLGFGGDFPGGFILSARYCIGLSNISETDGATLKNNIIMASAGYRFGGKRND